MENPYGLHSQVDFYLNNISLQRRYSPRTVEVYSSALERFSSFAGDDLSALNASVIRSFEVYLLDQLKLDSRTVNLHLSVLSGFCRFLVKRKTIQSNPVSAVSHPKTPKRLPVFFRTEAMAQYFKDTSYYASEEALEVMRQMPVEHLYSSMLARMVVSLLFSTGIRRSELIALRPNSFDSSRGILLVHGKGDKMRQVPLPDVTKEELVRFLSASELFFGTDSSGSLLRTPKGGALYPVFVDRIIKKEMGSVAGITGRKSPHVLRHTIATELLDDGADLNSIKELLGHSSLAATQVYTHNSIERLQRVYQQAHPRSKRK